MSYHNNGDGNNNNNRPPVGSDLQRMRSAFTDAQDSTPFRRVNPAAQPETYPEYTILPGPPGVRSNDPSVEAFEESARATERMDRLRNKVHLDIDIRNPSTFAFYGSAEKYYENAFTYIHNSYPYDGSQAEKVDWFLSASSVDMAVLQKEYPLATGSFYFSSGEAGDDWGNTADTSGSYSISSTPEYIKFSGSPRVGTLLDQSSNRTVDIQINPTSGNTIEFWMKKDGKNTNTDKEIIVDIHTENKTEADSDYARIQIAINNDHQGPNSTCQFLMSYYTGNRNGAFEQVTQFQGVSNNEWHHYAFTFIKNGDNLEIEVYLDGQFGLREIVNSSPVSLADGADIPLYTGTLGALAANFGNSGAEHASIGYGQLAAKLDEFRFWKVRRTAEQIQRYYDNPVNGATDEEQIDSILGLYYKFNQPYNDISALDEVVLDYSGRANNGLVIGHRATSRSAESAIALSEATANKEIGDPIINPRSTKVILKLAELKKIGKEYDDTNHASIFKTLPEWAFDDSQGSNNLDSDFSKLLQAIAAQFDQIRILIDNIPSIMNPQYQSEFFEYTTTDYSSNFSHMLGFAKKDLVDSLTNFSQRKFSLVNLLGKGFEIKYQPIINAIDSADQITNISGDNNPGQEGLPIVIHSKPEMIKERILSNVYNNLNNLYQSKGTHKAFRNVIRCFGVDEDLIAPFTYIDNIERQIVDDYILTDKTINMLDVEGQHSGVTLYQTASSSEEANYIPGKSDKTSMCFEAKIILPQRPENLSGAVGDLSIFGVNHVDDDTLSIASTNYSTFHVKAIKPVATNQGVYFSLTSSVPNFTEIRTPYYRNAYDGNPWVLAAQFYENTEVKLADYDNNVANSYTVEFTGYKSISGEIVSQFSLTSSMSKQDYDNLMSANKSVFAGAKRQNISGSLQEKSDCRLVSLTVWDEYLKGDELKDHAMSVDNLGRQNPLFKYADNRGRSLDAIDSIILHWQFDDFSNSSNVLTIVDAVSGSSDMVTSYGQTLGKKYPARTTALPTSDPNIIQDAMTGVEYLTLDNLHSRSKVEIKQLEIEGFALDTRPQTYMYGYEKSMYRIVSREMMKMLSGARAFNNLIGEPIHKYRQTYKTLDSLKQKFFSKIENDLDLEKFIDRYKWIDKSLTNMLEQIAPASAKMNIGMHNTVESHAFERNKYQHKAPQFEFKDPKLVGQVLGINELLYDWEHGHAPLLVEEPIYWAAFDGTDDFIDVPDHDDHNFGDSLTDEPFSLSAWVVFTDPSVNQAIVGKFQGNADSEYLLFTNGGYLQFNIYDEDTGSAVRIQSVTNSMPFTAGTLYNITVTYDGSGLGTGINIYIDGTLVSQTRTTGGSYTAMHNTGVNLQIGSTVLGTLDFARNMRHVMVFGAELDSSDVTELLSLYDKGKLNVSATTLTKYSDLISWWKLDGADLGSATATDAIGGHDGTFNGNAEIVLEGNFIFSERNQAENCLWWRDRAERDGILSTGNSELDEKREEIKDRVNKVVDGSTYVLARHARPYRFSSERQRTLDIGSNRNSNKNKELYTIIHQGKDITLNKSDIYEPQRCEDIINPQEEKVYTAKVDVEGTSGYLDMDSDLILPFTFYSSSAGQDFSNFKDNLKLTNIHDEPRNALQGPFTREHVGGMPHRRVPVGEGRLNRPEAFSLSATSQEFKIETPSGHRSIYSRGSQRFYNVENIRTDRDIKSEGNYDKVYEIIQIAGRSVNNRIILKSGSLGSSEYRLGRISGTVDYTVPTRPRAEHVFVSKFSSPGGPESMSHGARDRESGEFSIYDTLSYRNLAVRDVWNKLSKEYSEQFGWRSGSSLLTASVHMTNRNYFHMTGAEGEVSVPDNFFIQHQIPQNDFSYKWISDSAKNTKFEFVRDNDGFGHQHNFNTSSQSSIQFLSESVFVNPMVMGNASIGDHLDPARSILPTTSKSSRGIALSGNIAVIGDELTEDAANTNDIGSLYVFDAINGNYKQVKQLHTPDANHAYKLGGSIAVSGNYIAGASVHQHAADSVVSIFKKADNEMWLNHGGSSDGASSSEHTYLTSPTVASHTTEFGGIVKFYKGRVYTNILDVNFQYNSVGIGLGSHSTGPGYSGSIGIYEKDNAGNWTTPLEASLVTVDTESTANCSIWDFDVADGYMVVRTTTNKFYCFKESGDHTWEQISYLSHSSGNSRFPINTWSDFSTKNGRLAISQPLVDNDWLQTALGTGIAAATSNLPTDKIPAVYVYDNLNAFGTHVLDFTDASNTNGHIELNNTVSFFKEQDSFSLFSWIKHPTVTEANLHTLFSINSQGGDNRFIFGINGTNGTTDHGQTNANSIGTLMAYSDAPPAGGGDYLVPSTVRLDDDEWHQVGFVYDNSTLTLYVDGQQYGSVGIDFTPIKQVLISDGGNSGGKVSVGQEWDHGAKSDFWRGQIADLAVWSKALSSNEVASLYNHGGVRTGPSDLSTHTSENDLSIWYRMGDGSLSTKKDSFNPSEPENKNNRIHDMSGFNRHAQLDGFTVDPIVKNYFPIIESSVIEWFEDAEIENYTFTVSNNRATKSGWAKKVKLTNNYVVFTADDEWYYPEISKAYIYGDSSGKWEKQGESKYTLDTSGGTNAVRTTDIDATDEKIVLSLNQPGEVRLKALHRNGINWREIRLNSLRLNTSVIEDVNKDTNTIRPILPAQIKHILANREGTYGHPSWKQIRTAEHPVAIAHRKNNIFSRVYREASPGGSIIKSSKTPSMNFGAELFPSIYGPNDTVRKVELAGKQNQTRSRVIKNYKEVPVTSKFKAIGVTIHGVEASRGGVSTADFEFGRDADPRLPNFFKERQNIKKLDQLQIQANWFMDSYYYQSLSQKTNLGEAEMLPGQLNNPFLYFGHMSYKETLQNDMTSFANEELIEDMRYIELTDHKGLQFLNKLIKQNAEIDNRLIEINYIETIYPKEQNTYTSIARTRENFDYFGWKSNRSDRAIILQGSKTYTSGNSLLVNTNLTSAFPKITTSANTKRKTIFDQYDAVDVNSSSDVDLVIAGNMRSSKWPLDARRDFTAYPVSINESYFTRQDLFLASRNQATRGEGLLQNDFSTFPLGYNGLFGTPPTAVVYNRRVPQKDGNSGLVYLAGEARWQAADNSLGPFYDSYEEYSSDSLSLIGRDHSIVSEFRISEFTEDILKGNKEYTDMGPEVLSLTGSIYQTEAGNVSVNGKHFESYSNSDFLKYFSLVEEQVLEDNDLEISRFTLKCQAAMKFLPYEGFYPAERAVQINKMFSDNYLQTEDLNVVFPPVNRLPGDDRYLELRTKAARYNAEKVFFGPGILYNSIKSGMAVDYPIFKSFSDNEIRAVLPNSSLSPLSDHPAMTTDLYITGTIINDTVDGSIPRLSGSVTSRIEFEDLLNPVNVHGTAIYDNEPHPSASLIYGNKRWTDIIERPSKLGNVEGVTLSRRLGIECNNTRSDFAQQILPYTMAMQNFAAETVNFFLEEGQLATAVSKPIKEFFKQGDTYEMKVKMVNVATTMYDRPSAFGPPVDDPSHFAQLVAAPAENDSFDVFFKQLSAADWSTPQPSSGDISWSAFDYTEWPRLEIHSGSDGFNIVFVSSSVGDPFHPVTGSGRTHGNGALDLGPGMDGSVFLVDLGELMDNWSDHTSRASLITRITTTWTEAKDAGDLSTFGAGLDLSGIVDPDFDLGLGTSRAFKISGHESTQQSGYSIEAKKGGLSLAASIFNIVRNETFGQFAAGQLNRESLFDVELPDYNDQSQVSASHGYAPFVPPYLNADAEPYVKVSFEAPESREYLAREIIELCTFEYYNFKDAPSSANNSNYINAMSLSASLNLGMCVDLRSDNELIKLNEETGYFVETDQPQPLLIEQRRRVDENNTLSRWVIQSKWETPVLDFSTAEVDALDLDTRTVTAVTGSPWQKRNWNLYYTKSVADPDATQYLTASTGMWHQKGNIIPKTGAGSSKGYHLVIEDIPRPDTNPGLARKLGFNTPASQTRAQNLPLANQTKSKIGVLSDSKVVKEAVVVIPYILREEDNKVEFISLQTPRVEDRDNSSFYSKAVNNIKKLKREFALRSISTDIGTYEEYRDLRRRYLQKTKDFIAESPVNAIEYQLFMMDEFVLPPELDFTVTGQDPFLMYFFQFKAKLKKEDLANIWQNLYPVSSDSTAKARYSSPAKRFTGEFRIENDISYVSHYINTRNIIGESMGPAHMSQNLVSPDSKHDKTRWMIFKVKQRAVSNLEEIRKKSIDPRPGNIIGDVDYIKESKTSLSLESIPRDLPGSNLDLTEKDKLRFNWPYDYFSFVELIKIDAKVDIYNF